MPAPVVAPGESVVLAAGVLLGMMAFASASVAVVLPDLVRGLGISTEQGTWTISLYMLFMAVSTALWGRVADIFGIRSPLVVGCVLLAVGSLLAAGAPTFELLLVARVVQAVGAGSLPALVMTFLEQIYSGDARHAALATTAGTAVAAGAVGPLVGGLVADFLGWRAALLLPVLALVVLIPLHRWLPGTGAGAEVDLWGAACVTVLAAGVVLSLQSLAADPPMMLLGLVLAGLGAFVLPRHVRRRPMGFVPAVVARDARILVFTLGASSVPAVWFALMLVLPLTLAQQGWAAWQVGLAMTPGAVSGLLSSRFTPRVLRRWGAARATTAAVVVSLAAVVVAALAVHLDAAVATPVLLVLASFASTAVAAMSQAALVTLVGERFDRQVRGAAIGICTLVFLMGAAFGSAATSGLAGWFEPAGAVLALGVLPVLALVPIVVTMRPARIVG